MINLLFDKEINRKIRRRKSTLPINKESYNDITLIRGIIEECVQLPDNLVVPIRVRLIKTKPERCYRATLICKSMEKRSVKQKDGRLALVFAGQYVDKTWWVIKTMDGFVFEPSL